MYPGVTTPNHERQDMSTSMDRVRELAKEGVALYVRNNTRSTVTINDESGRMEVGHKGSSTSVLPLPPTKLNLPGLQRMIRKGLLDVGPFDEFRETWESTDPDSEVAPDLSDFQVTVEADKSKKDLIEKECLVTGKKVFQTLEEVKSDKPPLHESVAHLEREFVVRHVEKPEGGHEVTWDRVTIG